MGKKTVSYGEGQYDGLKEVVDPIMELMFGQHNDALRAVGPWRFTEKMTADFAPLVGKTVSEEAIVQVCEKALRELIEEGNRIIRDRLN